MHMRTLPLAALTATFAGLSGCGPDSAPKTLPPPEVLVTEATARDVPVTREWLGTVDGSENVDIRARVQGYLLEKKYSEGALVQKGDVLFIIDPRPFEAALLQAKAELSQAVAQQGHTEAEFQKQKELYSKNVTSQRDYDNANQANLANIASVDAAKAAVQRAELDLEFATVKAPVSGIAGISPTGIGDLVGPGSPQPLATISTVDPIKVRFPISEQEYLFASERIANRVATPLAEREDDAELILADGSVFPHKGKFSTIDREVNVKTGTLNIETLFANPGNVLRPGQYARVRVVVRTEKNAVLVPQRAVIELQGSYQLALVGADGKAEIRPVTVGDRQGSSWIVTSGLKAGERVIVEGIQKVKTGVPVSAKPWTAPAAPPPASPAPRPEPK
jgi:membrane fusion protein (multidrug efflux system)